MFFLYDRHVIKQSINPINHQNNGIIALTNHQNDGLIVAETGIGAKTMKYIIPEYTTAEHIKELRKRLNMTQKEFAEFAG